MTASTAKILPTPLARAAIAGAASRSAPRRDEAGPRWREVLHDGAGAAFLLAAILLLWTATWAAIAGPIAPAREPGAAPVVDAGPGAPSW